MHRSHYLLVVILLSLVSACQLPGINSTQSSSTEEVSINQQPTKSELIGSGIATPYPHVTATISATQQVESTPAFQFNPYDCEQSACVLTQPVIFQRPIEAGLINRIDATYPFGSNSEGKYEVHHGVEFVNPSGTEIHAVGDGVVIFAGNDLKTRFADWLNFYGNLVIIKHDSDAWSEPIFSLYGHLSKILVTQGQTVEAGELIGQVGATGYAIGSHLHFELRLGENVYQRTVNPVLWLVAHQTELDGLKGNLGGVVLDRWGNRVADKEITIAAQQKDGAGRMRRFFIKTYADTSLAEASPFGENFVLADLPAGKYLVTIYDGTMHEAMVTILPGKTTFVTIRVP